jgi:hypothetical protein
MVEMEAFLKFYKNENGPPVFAIRIWNMGFWRHKIEGGGRWMCFEIIKIISFCTLQSHEQNDDVRGEIDVRNVVENLL